MHLVGFTIEIYYDARPYESQNAPFRLGVPIDKFRGLRWTRPNSSPTFTLPFDALVLGTSTENGSPNSPLFFFL